MGSSRLTMVLSCGAAVGLAVALVAFLSWQRRQDAGRAVTQPPPPAAAAAATAGGGPSGLPAWLVAARPDAPSRFVLLPWVEPKRFCAALGRSGLRGATYVEDEPGGRGWSCVTDLIKPVEGDEAVVSSLFVSARGLEPGRLDVLRLKLNLLDPATAPAVKRRARETLRRLFAQFRWRAPQAALDAIGAQREERFVERGVVFELRKEFVEAVRLNVVVTFPRALVEGGFDRFVPSRRPPAPLPAPPAPVAEGRDDPSEL